MSQRTPYLHLLLATSFIILAGGCASRMVGSGPHPISSLSDSEPAMVYYLAKDVLHVQGTAHYVTSGEVTIQEVSRRDKKGKKHVKPCFVVSNEGPVFVESDVEFSFKPTVDSNAFYRLDTRPGWFRKNTQSLGLTAGGVLATVDARGEGQGHVALGAVSRVVASAATISGALGAPVPVPTDKTGALAGLSPRDQYFYTANPSALEWRDELSRLAAMRQKLLDGQIELASRPADEMAGAVLKEKVVAYQKAQELIEQELADMSTTLQAAMDGFFAEIGVTEASFSKSHVARFELSEIPPHHVLPSPTSRIDALKALRKDYPKMADCVRELRVLFTIDGSMPTQGVGTEAEPQECAAIFYRMPLPGVLRVYRHGEDAAAPEEGAARELQLTEIRDVSLLHASMPATPLPSHPSVWTTRRAQIKLDANHRPKELTWQSGAVVADTADAVAEALSDLRDEAVTTAEQTATFRNKMRDARLAGLQDDIERLAKKRKRLEAQIDLQGAVATADQRRELIQLTAQSDLLETQADMVESQRRIAGDE